MKKVLSLMLAIVIVLTPFTALADDGMYDGYKIEETEMVLTVDGEVKDVATYLVKTWDKSGETPRETKQVVIKLRDLAALLKDSDAKFSVDYNEEKGAVELTRGGDYEQLDTDLKKLDLENVHIEPSTSIVNVDEKDVAITGVKINNHNYYRLSVLGSTLDNFRFYTDYEDSNKAFIDTITKSDIEEFDQAEFEKILGESEYTIVYNWGPWCPYCRIAIPKMEEMQKYYAENDIDVQVVGMISRYKNNTKEDINELFEGKEASWRNFGLTPEAYTYLEGKFGSKIKFYPFRFILDKEGNLVSKEFFDYYEEIVAEYLEKTEKTKDELTEEEEDELEKQTYLEFLERAIKEKE